MFKEHYLNIFFMSKNRDLISEMSELDRLIAEEHLKCVNPDDAKYWKSTAKVSPFLSAHAEWLGCAYVQRVLLETRVEFGRAEQHNLDEVDVALKKISPLNIALLEDELQHDQLAVIEEIGRFVSDETKSLLHPGTTSYDILDTTRAYLLKKAWSEAIRPKIKEVALKLCSVAEGETSDKVKFLDLLQVGRTHLQDTSPVLYGSMLASQARRLAECIEECDKAFYGLRGKISGIVGSGASIEVVIGKDEPDHVKRRELALEFERKVLAKLGLEPDYTATQVVQKERLMRVAMSMVALSSVAANFSNRIRILYSSAIGEVTSRDSKARLGGSSADAGKNNPVNYENVAGKFAVIESGLRVVCAQSETDLERDLRNSVQGRYEPQLMMTRTYESFVRLSKALDKLSVNDDVMRENLVAVRNKPSEAMTAITRAHGYIHPKYGIGHDAVKEFAKLAQFKGMKLVDVALADEHFKSAFNSWPDWHQRIIQGELELYVGPSKVKALENIEYVKALK